MYWLFQFYFVCAAVLYAVPYFRQGGWLYAILIVGSLLAMRDRFHWKIILCLVALAAYQGFVVYFLTDSLGQLAAVNSGSLVQLGGVAVLLITLEKLGSRSLYHIACIVCLVAAGSVLLESSGLDPQKYIPSKYRDSVSYATGTIYYDEGLVRLRGVYPEASVLSAVSAGILFSLLYGRFRLRPRLNPREQLLYWLATASSLSVLTLTLTKAGLLVLAAAVAGIGGSLLIRPNLRTLLHLLSGAGAVALLIGGLFAAGENRLSTYLRNEYLAVNAAIHGHRSEADINAVGAATRMEGYQIALRGLVDNPLGHAPSDAPKVAERFGISLSSEMTEGFESRAFGLKNYFSNVVFSAGIIGIVLLALLCYLTPATQFFGLGIPRLEMADVSCSVVAVFIAFSASIEDRYYVPGFLLLLTGVFRYFAENASSFIPAGSAPEAWYPASRDRIVSLP